jgi:hypothetical protein
MATDDAAAKESAQNAAVTVVAGLAGTAVLAGIGFMIHPIIAGIIGLVGLGSVVYQATLAVQ